VFARKEPLTPMTPVEQLRSGGLPLRLAQLLVGLWLYGASMAMLVRGRLGLPAWDVFHVGVQRHWGASFGTVVIVTSFAVLLLWIPLRQWPGLGTLANSVLIGVAADATLRVLGPQDGAATRWGLMLGGILLNGLAGALYIGSQLGPGPRDGLMTGSARRTGRSIRLVRTGPRDRRPDRRVATGRGGRGGHHSVCRGHRPGRASSAPGLHPARRSRPRPGRR
jgi:uncharacterized membrane protein YczE